MTILSRREVKRFSGLPDNDREGYMRTQAIADAVALRASMMVFPRDYAMFALQLRQAFDEVEAEVRDTGIGAPHELMVEAQRIADVDPVYATEGALHELAETYNYPED